MSLSDNIPNHIKKSLLLPEGLVIGTVIRAFVTTTIPPKEKRFIVIGFCENKISLASIFINSEINLRVNYSQELIAQHVYLESFGREYLTHDSYVDCSQYKEMEVENIEKKINDKPEIIIGHVKKEDLDILMHTLKNSDQIKGKYKKRFGFYDYE